MTTAIIDWSPTKDAAWPSATSRPPPSPHRPTTASAGMNEWPASDPTRAEKGIASAANTIGIA
jgi:hypothetical protein